MNTLQSLTLPNLDMQVDEDMYVRLNDRCWSDLAARRLCFSEGGLLFADTFYNGLSVGVWKRRCNVPDLHLQLRGHGEFLVSLGLHRTARSAVWLDQRRLTLTPEGSDWPVEAWPELTDGMLFLRLRALGSGELYGGAFVTTRPPPNEVRLGLVITHFNRTTQVQAAVGRISRELLDRIDVGEHVTLTVVDNSRNLVLTPHRSVMHIANRNLGGTGGFVRGLLAVKEEGRHTHALFMDDDASCEIDSLARCLALLQYAKDPRLSVAGALLREVAPWQLLEKGARFDGQVQPLKAGLDMRRVHDLLEAEREDSRPDYGAWWLFAFPIAEVRDWPFPFFVRGDDIYFGLRNRFDIATMNGIVCLGEDFSTKQGPMTAYLDARYHMVLGLLSADGGAGPIVWVGCRLFTKAMTSYLYGSAHAVTLAVRDVLAGPAFFRDNIDLASVRAEIMVIAADEKLLPIQRSTMKVQPPQMQRESRWRRLGRVLTLHGFLLPDLLIRNRTTVQAKAFHGKASAVFRYRRVLYEHAQSGQGFIAEFNRKRFFAELRDFLKVWLLLLVRLPRLRDTYRAGSIELGSEAFWRDVYADVLQPRGMPVDAVARKADNCSTQITAHDEHPYVRTPVS